MEGSAATAGVFPASRKMHVAGTSHPDIRVPMREIKLTPTAAGHGPAPLNETANPPVTVYDTSGPYTDPDVTIELDKGLAPMRLPWISARGDVEEYEGRDTRPEDDGRTLIYVGRDYDAAPAYWAQVAPTAPAAKRTEVGVRAQKARASFTSDRVALPAKPEDWGWFTMDGTMNTDAKGAPIKRLPKQLTGHPNWTAGVDATKLDIELYGQITPKSEDDVEVLLASGADVLVSRRGVGKSQRIVVANGSFLLNFPLVNHQHRKLAGSLIAEVGEEKAVYFLESSSTPPLKDEEEASPMPTLFDFLEVPPVSYVLLHLVFVALIFGYSRWPIFGVPREEKKLQWEEATRQCIRMMTETPYP
ncbi:MAG: hypothetical protein IH987_20765, partial [Planctomycetes bacterium]|nr:hypothetical protein [Planctomycetota bacterium]